MDYSSLGAEDAKPPTCLAPLQQPHAPPLLPALAQLSRPSSHEEHFSKENRQSWLQSEARVVIKIEHDDVELPLESPIESDRIKRKQKIRAVRTKILRGTNEAYSSEGWTCMLAGFAWLAYLRLSLYRAASHA